MGFNKKIAVSFGYPYLFYFSLSILLIVLDSYHQLESVRVLCSKITSPILYSIDTPGEIVKSLRQQITHRRQLYQENQALKDMQVSLQAKLNYYMALEEENKHLHRLLNSTPFLQPHYITVARPLHINITQGRQELLLNKLPEQSLAVGQVVLDGEGIVGQIIEVQPSITRVLCISDQRSSVPVEVARHKLRGILIGQGPNQLLKLNYLPKTVDIKVGDILVTSGLGGRYPRGYPVARVVHVEDHPSEPYLRISAAPTAALNINQPLLVIQVN